MPEQECAQELARCLCEGGDQPGTEAHFRIQEIISARVRATAACCCRLLSCPVSDYLPQKSASFLLLPKRMEAACASRCVHLVRCAFLADGC